MLFLGERGVRFDPYVGLGGRPFFARLSINDLARRIGVRCLFAHLCQEAIKRGEHLSVVESDGASLAGRFGVRLAFEIRSGLQDLRASVWSPPGAGGLPGGGGDRERAREVTTRTAMVPCVGLGFVTFGIGCWRGPPWRGQARFRTIQARPQRPTVRPRWALMGIKPPAAGGSDCYNRRWHLGGSPCPA
jgi:hypothetical protein